MEEFHDGQTKRKKFLNEQTFSSLFTGKFFTRSPKKKKKNENHFILHTITFLGLHCGVFILKMLLAWALNYHSSFSASQQQTENVFQFPLKRKWKIHVNKSSSVCYIFFLKRARSSTAKTETERKEKKEKKIVLWTTLWTLTFSFCLKTKEKNK